MVSGAKLGWLSTLKYSTRSCSFQRSVKWKYFETCTSQTAVLGSRSTFFPPFPKVGRAQVGPKVAQLAFRAAVDRNAAGLSQLTLFADARAGIRVIRIKTRHKRAAILSDSR